MHGGDDRLRARLDGGAGLKQDRRRQRLAEFADVRAGGECASGAGDDDSADSRIAAELFDGCLQLGADGQRGGVDRRVVDGNESNRAAQFAAHDRDIGVHDRSIVNSWRIIF
jgi:hypothetical protein